MALTWRLTDDDALPTVDLLLLSHAKSVRAETAYTRSLLELRERIREEGDASGRPIGSSEYVCTAMDRCARDGLRKLGFNVTPAGPPIHISHTYLRGSGPLDLIERIVRSTRGTYTRPHGDVLATYGSVKSAAYNLLAFDDDPFEDDRTRTAACWAFDKPPHEAVRYDTFDPLVGTFVETTRDRSESTSGAAWRKKLGLGATPQYWVEWRSTSPFTFAELDVDFGAWKAPRAVKALAAQGWRFLATRLG